MPADDGVGLHDDQGIGPAGAELPQEHPEAAIARLDPWPGDPAGVEGELLPESEPDEGLIASVAEERQRGSRDQLEVGDQPHPDDAGGFADLTQDCRRAPRRRIIEGRGSIGNSSGSAPDGF